MTPPAGPVGVDVVPVTPDRWEDLETLFGDRGACGGCWCMHWRVSASDYEAGKGDLNRQRLKERVGSGPAPPGVLAYAGHEPAGWCAVSPREEYVRMERSRVLAPVDDRAVWSIVCFFVSRPHRGRGLTRRLIEGAVELAASNGASVVEGYPVEPPKGRTAPVFVFTGLASAYRAAGFEEVERRSPTRPIMRHYL